MTQTTAGRITEIIREHLKFYAGSGEWAAAVEAGQEIAAEIDALTRERDEARAEAERLRLAAEAWEARYRWGKTIDGTAESVKAQIAMEDAEDQAAAAKEAKP